MDKFQSLIQSNKPVLVDFFAEWCGPCKTMAPILKDLKSRIGEKAIIIKVDIDKNQQAAAAFGINSVPTLMLFRDGKALWKQTGVLPANEIQRVIEQHI